MVKDESGEKQRRGQSVEDLQTILGALGSQPPNSSLRKAA